MVINLMKRSQGILTLLPAEKQFYTMFSGLGRPLVIYLERISFM